MLYELELERRWYNDRPESVGRYIAPSAASSHLGRRNRFDKIIFVGRKKIVLLLVGSVFQNSEIGILIGVAESRRVPSSI